MIFLDTSAIYALADRDDANNAEALRLFNAALTQGERFVVHNYILVEAAALLHTRLGKPSAEQFLRDAVGFTTIWLDEEGHGDALERFTQTASTKVSFVDAASFAVMMQHRITHYLGFDKHFTQEGFTPFTA